VSRPHWLVPDTRKKRQSRANPRLPGVLRSDQAHAPLPGAGDSTFQLVHSSGVAPDLRWMTSIEVHCCHCSRSHPFFPLQSAKAVWPVAVANILCVCCCSSWPQSRPLSLSFSAFLFQFLFSSALTVLPGRDLPLFSLVLVMAH
jgi:hypothetical protein